jgi:hypothetical protein
MLKKYENLQNKHNNLINQSMPKSILNKKEAIVNDFPMPERLPNEKVREAYHKLLTSYKELMYEKEDLHRTLREETLANEEQRNYIEILKQTIESSLIKYGLSNYIQTQKYISLYIEIHIILQIHVI